MERTRVESSAIASVGYAPERRRMEVEFTSGRVYEYTGVPESVYRGMLGAESHGRYFTAHVRSAGFPCRKLR